MRPDDLNNRFPIIPHEAAGVDCHGCIIVKVHGTNAELVCNECGQSVGVIHAGVLNDLVSLIPDWISPKVSD